MEVLVRAGVTEGDARWALAVIQSRAFGNGMGQEILVPFIDIMNHGDLYTNSLFSDHPRANVTYGWQQHDQLPGPEKWKMVIQAQETILEGEELFVSYGDHSNEFFLLYYGFVPLYNPRDAYTLFNNLDEILSWFFERFPSERGSMTDDQLEQLKRRIRIEGQMQEVVKMNLCADGSVSPIMEQFLKFLCHGDVPQGRQLLRRISQEHLQNSTTLLEDLKLLSESTPSTDPYFGFPLHRPPPSAVGISMGCAKWRWISTELPTQRWVP